MDEISEDGTRYEFHSGADVTRWADGAVEFSIEVEAHGGDFVDAVLRLEKPQQLKLIEFLLRGLL